MDEPLISPSKSVPELTFRAIVIAIILAVILAASNAYLALKIGTTIAASIPASVLALGILRFFKNSNVLESNIIQTAASAGEGMAAGMSFILPAMIVLGVWQGFPYWETTIIGLLGGILGVLFSIPLRRILLSMKDLSFPEGTAVGNVLRSASKGGAQLKYLIQGASVGGLVSFFQSGLKLLSDNIQLWTTAGRSLFGMGFGLTSATLAAGYIIGFEVGISLLLGVIVGWVFVMPWLGFHFGISHTEDVYSAAMDLWDQHLRFVGVGTMLIGGVWTLVRLAKPVMKGLAVSLNAMRLNKDSSVSVLRTESDIPIHWVLLLVALISTCAYGFFIREMLQMNIYNNLSDIIMIAGVSVIYVVIVGFLLATVCGYFVGLVGSTNSPISGILIMAVLVLSLIYSIFFPHDLHASIVSAASLVIVVVGVMAGIATIANENIQDLKAGQMVGATPWKQQVMLVVGVIASTLVIGPVLELLFKAYGMAGVFPHPGMSHAQMLGAPQASLMAAVTRGVLTHNLQWGMIGIGAVIALAMIVLDEIASKHSNFRFPPLAVGLAIYLPPEIMTPIIMGGFISYFVKTQHAKKALGAVEQAQASEKNHQAVLIACGMVAGSAVMGVVLAIPFVLMGSSDALAIVPASFLPYANLLGVIVFGLLCLWFYRAGIFKKQ